jgi:pyruvate dehydrogenase E1 component alpha subunit
MSDSAWDPEGLAVDLDANGQLHGAASVDPDAAVDLRALYKQLVRARVVELRLARLGLPAWASAAGDEAPLCAVGSQLRAGDWLYPTARDRVAALGRGTDVTELVTRVLGLNDVDQSRVGEFSGEGVAPVPARIGLGIAIATGHARGLERDGGVVCAVFGEGTTTTGDFAESLALAARRDIPLVLVCKTPFSPGWPDVAPAEAGVLGEPVCDRVRAYGWSARRCDGADPVSTHRVIAAAFARARAGDGPAFVECVTSPMHLDPPASRDPIDRLRRRLDNDGIWTQTFQDVIEAEVRGHLERVVTRWTKEASA